MAASSINYDYHLYNGELKYSMLPRFLNLLHDIGAIVNSQSLFPKLNYADAASDNFYITVLNQIRTIMLPTGTLVYHTTSNAELIHPSGSSTITFPLHPFSYFALSSDTSIAVILDQFLGILHNMGLQGILPTNDQLNTATAQLFTFRLTKPLMFIWKQLNPNTYIEPFCKLQNANYMTAFYKDARHSGAFYDGMIEFCIKETDSLQLIQAQIIDIMVDAKREAGAYDDIPFTNSSPLYYNNLLAETGMDSKSFLERYGSKIDYNTFIISEIELAEEYER